MAEDGRVKIECFDGRDFGFWKMRIEDYLYQKKLHEPLSETKPSGMKQEDWAMLDRHALGVVRLSLAKNVAFNIVNEKTTFSLLKALSNMYEKPSALNKVFLIRQLVNTKMTEGVTVIDHVNEFNLVISKLLSVDIKFDDEMHALLLLSSLPNSWSGTATVVSSTSGTNKLTFEDIRDMILGEDIHRGNSKEYLNSLSSATGHVKKSNRGRSRSRKKSNIREHYEHHGLELWVSFKKALVDSLVMAIPFQNGPGHSMETIGKQNDNPRHIDGVWLTKPQPNYFYRVVSKPISVNGEASTSQPKGNKEASSQPKSNANGQTFTSQPKENKEATLETDI
ncbi:hypothetical protein Tco_1418246 [Tanacetum coccineum]